MASTGFLLGHSGRDGWRAATEDCATQIGPAGGRTIGFVYASDAFADHFADIVALLRASTGVGPWFGTVGIGVCASGVEYFDGPGLVALVGDLAGDSFRAFDGAVAPSGATPFGIVHGDPRHGNVLEDVAGLAADSGAFLVGALTSSRGDQAQVAGTNLARSGLSGALFAESVIVATGLTQGCSPLGPKRSVTAGDGNRIETIDGEPAVAVLAEDLARDGGDVRHAAAGLQVAFPIPGSDTGDYLVRNLMGIDGDTGALAVAHRVAEGDAIQFCRRDAAAARKDLDAMLGRLKRRAPAPRGGLYFSCLARGPNLFGPGSTELRAIDAAFPGLPVAGFFGNGEFSAGRFYTYTGVLALFL